MNMMGLGEDHHPDHVTLTRDGQPASHDQRQ